MNDVFGSILPLAIAVTISPVPIIAEILLLFTGRRIPNAGGFVVGFTLGLTAVLGVLLVLAGTQDLSADGDASTAGAVLRAVLGALLILGAVRRFRSRPEPGETAATPSWMDGIESFGPARSLVVGLVVGAANPKNVAMAVGAAVAISAADLSGARAAAAVAVYVVVAVLGVAAPFVVAVAMGDSAQPVLDSWKAWLGEHNAAVMSVLFLVFGVVLFSQGVAGM